MPDFGAVLPRVGASLLTRLGPALAEADPQGSIRPASRLLCAGLAELAGCVHRARAATEPPVELLEAAALLSLLTKLDDQVIDGRPFHGGPDTDRDALRLRTDAHLAPTLASIGAAAPATQEPRCALAARLGRALRQLCPDPDRRAPLLELIARGWAIQTEAVATLTDRPSRVPLERVDRVTADISGAWLSMIAFVGALPAAAGPWPSPDERGAMFDWGLHIQRADALSDLDKDLGEGLICTAPGWRAWRAAPDRFDAALAGEPGAMHALFAELEVDLACLPDPAELDRLDARLDGLGELSGLLRWIHGFLLARWVTGPLAARSPEHPQLKPLLSAGGSWHTALRGRSPCSGP